MRPTHAAILNGYKLQGDGNDIASVGNDVTKWKHIPIEYDPDVTYSIAAGACSDGRTWLASLTSATLTLGVDDLTFQIVENGTPTSFTRDGTVTEAIMLNAGSNAKMQIDIYPGGAAKCRVKYKISPSTNLSGLAVRINGYTGLGSALNSGRGGSWNGRHDGTLTSSAAVHILVMDAVKKFPRGYNTSGSYIDLIMHDDSIAVDSSLSTGVYDLSEILSSNLDTNPLNATYQALLDGSGPVHGANLETGSSYAVSVWISMDFWISLDEEVEVVPPVILLDGYDAYPIWWAINKDGIGNADLEPVEQRIIDNMNTCLSYGAQGQLCYGDFRHSSPFRYDLEADQSAWYRIRYLNHYFSVVSMWRGLLRTGRSEYYELARIQNNVLRDNCWSLGGKTHAKNLTTWSCCWTATGHDVDSESLLFAWLVDHDYHSLSIYKDAMTVLLTYALPSVTNFREACVNIRMLRVMYWFSGNSTYLTKADSQTTAAKAEFNSKLADANYTTYGILDMTGAFWHPYWSDEYDDLDYPFAKNSGIFSFHHAYERNILASTPRQSVNVPERSPLGFVKYGPQYHTDDWPSPGPNGHRSDAMMMLQMETIYRYLEDKRLEGKKQLMYGSVPDNGTPGSIYRRHTIKFTKTDANPSHIRLLLSNRFGGDINQHTVSVTSPSAVTTNLTASTGGYVPHYFQYKPGAFAIQDMTPVEIQGGVTAYQKIFPFSGESGEWTITVKGYESMLFGPMTIYDEWQEIDDILEPDYFGEDEEGFWPVDDGILFSHASGWVEPLVAESGAFTLTGSNAEFTYTEAAQASAKIYVQQSQQPSVLYGVNSDSGFKVNVSLVSGSTRRKRGNVLHLSKAKTKLSTVFALFDAIVSGINLDTEEFIYISDDQLLTITNVSGATGIEPSVSAGIYAIPLFPATDYGVAFSSIHLPKIPTATGGT